MSEDNQVQLEQFRFTESFQVEFYVEAENYQKAKDILGWTPKGDLPTWVEKYKKDLGIQKVHNGTL